MTRVFDDDLDGRHSAPAPSTPGSGPSRWRRDHDAGLPHVHVRPEGSARTRDTSTPAERTRRARRWSETSPRSKAARTDSRSASGMGCVDSHHEAVQARAITSSAERTSTGGRSGSSTRSFRTSACEFTYVDTRDPTAHRGRMRNANRRRSWSRRRRTRSMRLTDLAAAGRDRASRAARCSSSTTPSRHPCFQRPFEHGADIVYHSTTKYLNGHSDMVGGIAVAQRRRPGRAAPVHPERGRRRSRAVRLLARPSWHEDAAPPHARHTTPMGARSLHGSPTGLATSG